jgi:NADPH2:quinone reductase
LKAIIVAQPGGIETLEFKEVTDPQPGPGEVLIDIAYAGCNWMDTQRRRGVYPDKTIAYPYILGCEVAGYIAEVGAGVSEFQVGDKVAAIIRNGGYAEKCVANSVTTMKLPEDMDLKLGACFQIVALTGYHLLFSAHRLEPSDTILVHAIGGAVGLMVTQIAKEAGAKVIGTVSSQGKGDKALALGADRIIVRSEEDFVEAALEFTDGEGVDLVIDSLGGDTGFRSHEALRHYGRLINIGEAEDWPREQGLRDKLYERSTSFAGFETMASIPGSQLWYAGVNYIVPRVADGRIEVPIAKTYNLENCQQMHRDLETRTVSGKLVLSTEINRG